MKIRGIEINEGHSNTTLKFAWGNGNGGFEKAEYPRSCPREKVLADLDIAVMVYKKINGIS